MLEIFRVRTGKQRRDFLNLPLKLYGDNPCFTPPLYADEKKLIRRGFAPDAACPSEFFIAYRDGEPVGRIQGIWQKDSNAKSGENRVRFTRFDCTDDSAAAAALFDALENWARSLGMDTVCGPLGCSDLEREGLLIEGFEYAATFEEQYNAPYYRKLIEECGYRKETDWLEYRIFPRTEDTAELERTAEYILRRNRLHYVDIRNMRKALNTYYDDFVDLIDDAYFELYGEIALNAEMKKKLLKDFKLMIDSRFLRLVANEEGRLVYFSIAFPSLGEALRHSGGHLKPLTVCRLLKALRRPTNIDLGLVGVAGDYKSRGIGALVVRDLADILQKENLRYAETNLCLEDNHAILNTWKQFEHIQHKRRRAYVKNL